MKAERTPPRWAFLFSAISFLALLIGFALTCNAQTRVDAEATLKWETLKSFDECALKAAQLIHALPEGAEYVATIASQSLTMKLTLKSLTLLELAKAEKEIQKATGIDLWPTWDVWTSGTRVNAGKVYIPWWPAQPQPKIKLLPGRFPTTIGCDTNFERILDMAEGVRQ